MNITSGKFKILSDLRQDAAIRSWIPDFCLVVGETSVTELYFDGIQSFILRSALKGEGLEYFGSGRSQSIKGIITKNNYDKALGILQRQENVAEIILQREVPTTHHYTAFISRSWCYCEETFIPDGRRSLISSQFRSGGIVHQAEFEKISDQLSSRDHQQMIVEWGISHDQIFIFQITPVIQSQMKTYAANRMIDHLYEAFLNWRPKKSFYGLLAEEWTAFRVRKWKASSKKFEMNDLFINWQCLMHYFYLYCLMYRAKSNHDSWIRFLKSTYDKSLLGSFALEHIKLANIISEKIGVPGPGSFNEKFDQLIYLGKGIWVGKISECQFMETLEAKTVYSTSKEQIIFTRDSRVLSHGFLAATETLTKVVANIDQETWSSLQLATHVNIDFSIGLIKFE